MIFKKSLIRNSVDAANQWDQVTFNRKAMNASEKAFRHIIGNTGLVPRDVYQDFDRQAVEVMNPTAENVMLTDLLAQSYSVNIGKITHKYRQVSDAGRAQTSMTGRTGIKSDKTDNKYDGAIVPIHDVGFDRDWREHAGGLSEQYDALIDDHRETLLTLNRHIQANLMDGHNDANGDLIVVDGLSWGGLRNDSRVAQIDLGAGGLNFDFTVTSKTYLEIEAAFKAMRDVMWIDNNCGKELNYYVSLEIASNIERASSENYASQQVLQRLAGLVGVKSLRPSSDLTGNQISAYPDDGESIRPIVGMAINTIALPRPLYNSPHAFITAAGIGFQVKNDYNGNTCVMYASA